MHSPHPAGPFPPTLLGPPLARALLLRIFRRFEDKKEDSMEARLFPTRQLPKLTQENHPENIVPEPAKAPTITLPSIIGICALCGIVGMTFGAGMLSTAFLADGPGEVVSLIPLVATAVAFLSGWVGAFFWMCREEKSKQR
jgi:hypothetical protein